MATSTLFSALQVWKTHGKNKPRDPGAIWTMICVATAVAAPMPVGITSEAITAATTAGRPCAVSFGICWTMPMMIPFVARSSAAWTPWRDKGVRPHDR